MGAARIIRTGVAALALLLVLLPAVADAGTLTRERGIFGETRWAYAGSSAGTSIGISAISASAYRLTDGEPITVAPGSGVLCGLDCGCTRQADNVVDCPNARLTVSAGGGNDSVLASTTLTPDFPLTLLGEAGIDQLRGGDGADVLNGGGSNDTLLDGQGANDTILGGLGADTGINGGAGTDTLSYADDRGSGVNASLATGFEGDEFTSIESLTGTAQADTLTGNGASNVINGLGGDDTLVGGVGGDDLNGGPGTDTASYADGRGSGVTATIGGATPDGDAYAAIEGLTGTPQDDSLSGDGGPNRLDGGAGNDVLVGAGGADELVGGAGSNRASYEERSEPVVASIDPVGARPDGDTYAQIQNLRGGNGDDVLAGSAEENQLEGGPGDDVLIGGADDDDLFGGGGRNVASYEERGAAVTADLRPSGAKPDSDVYVDIHGIRGGAGDDVLTGDDAANVLEGGPGADRITGLGGVDDLRSGAGDDAVTALDGAPDVVDCGDGTDVADADGSDALTGCETARRPDSDADGADDAADCAPGDPRINPSAAEVPDNDVDENCDGIKAVSPPPDRDRDGFPAGPLDCDDANAEINRAATDVRGNALDEDCDGTPAPFELIATSFSFTWQFFGARTRLESFDVLRVPAGATVRLTCSRRGCGFRRVTKRVRTATTRLSLVRRFDRRKLRPGTVIEVRVIVPGALGVRRRLVIRRGKDPKIKQGCVDPARGKLVRCP